MTEGRESNAYLSYKSEPLVRREHSCKRNRMEELKKNQEALEPIVEFFETARDSGFDPLEVFSKCVLLDKQIIQITRILTRSQRNSMEIW